MSSRPDATKELVLDRMHNYKQGQAQLPVKQKERECELPPAAVLYHCPLTMYVLDAMQSCLRLMLDECLVHVCQLTAASVDAAVHVTWDKFWREVIWQVYEQVLEQRDLVARIRLANLGSVLVLLHDSGLQLADVLCLRIMELCLKGWSEGTGWQPFLLHLRQPSWPPLPELEFRPSQVQNRLYSRTLRRWQFGPPHVVPDYVSAVWWLGKLHKLRLRLGDPILDYLFRDPG